VFSRVPDRAACPVPADRAPAPVWGPGAAVTLHVLSRDTTGTASSKSGPEGFRRQGSSGQREHKWRPGGCARCAMRKHWPGARESCTGVDEEAAHEQAVDVARARRLLEGGMSVAATARRLGTTAYRLRKALAEVTP